MSKLYDLVSEVEIAYNGKYEAFCNNHNPSDIYKKHKTNNNSLNNSDFFIGTFFKEDIDDLFSEIKEALQKQALTNEETQSIEKLLRLLLNATTTDKTEDLIKQLPSINEEAMSVENLGIIQRLTSALKSLAHAIITAMFSFSSEKTDYHWDKANLFFNEAKSGERKNESTFISKSSSHASNLFFDLSHIRNIEQSPEQYSVSELAASSRFSFYHARNKLPSLSSCQEAYEELENTMAAK